MKLQIKPNQLKYLLLGAGGLGFLLRILLYTTGTDEQGFLITGHWAAVSLWLLTAATGGLLFVATRPIQGPQRYADCFPTSPAGAAGAILAALGFLLVTITGMAAAQTTLDIIVTVLGFVSALALGFVGFCRLFRMKPPFILHAIVSVSFALRMVCQYRIWNSDPQLQDYCFYMMAYVCLMLTAYQFAAFDAGIGNHRNLWFLGLLSVYLCCLSPYSSQDSLFLICCGGWVFTNLTALAIKPRRQRRTLVLDESTPEET